MVNNSNLPISIKNEDIHLATCGRALQENSGPNAPKPGPILLILDNTTLKDSKKSSPKAIKSNVLAISTIMYINEKARTVV